MGPQASPPRSRGYLHTALTLFVILSLRAPSIEAQTGPRIFHDGLRCVLSGEHRILEALVEPTDGLTTVKAYFRADLYRPFHYVEMVPAGDVYQGVLPKPSPESTGLHYYLEAMDSSFNFARTAEYTPQVVSNEASCRERNPTPAAYPPPPPGGGGGGGGPTVTISKSGPASAPAGVSFTYTVSITNTGASAATGITMTDPIPPGLTLGPITFTAPTVDSCSGGAIVTCNIASLAPGATSTITIDVTPVSGNYTNTANLTVTSPAESSSSSRGTSVPLKATPGSPGRINTRLTSHLDLPPGDGGTQAQVTFNEFSSAVTDNSGPSTHEVQGRSGENIVEGFVTRNPRGEGVWRFDFRGALGFVPGSFTIDAGQIVSRQTHELVFRVAPGVRRIRFRFRLE